MESVLVWETSSLDAGRLLTLASSLQLGSEELLEGLKLKDESWQGLGGSRLICAMHAMRPTISILA